MDEVISRKHENQNDENIEINQLVEFLNTNYNNDLKKKLKELYITKIFANKVIYLFYKNNENKIKNIINFDDVLFWSKE